MSRIAGRVVPGHGVATGRAAASPYPRGTIELQAPHFLANGIDLSAYFAGTLNVDVAPCEPVPDEAAAAFDGALPWFEGIVERFVLSRATLRFDGRECEGLWYYPHPATKPDHFQAKTVVELLLPWIEGIAYGDAVELHLSCRV